MPSSPSILCDWSASFMSQRWFLFFLRLLFPNQIQRPLQFQFQLRPSRQLNLLPAPCFCQIRLEGRQRGTLRNLLFVAIFYALNRPHGCSSGRRLCSVFLRAAAPFNDAFLQCPCLDAVIPGNRRDLRHDRQFPKARLDLVERQPDLCPPGSSSGLKTAYMPHDQRACRQIASLAGFERLKCSHAKFLVLAHPLRADVSLKPYQEFRSRDHGEPLDRLSMPAAIDGLALRGSLLRSEEHTS